MNRVVAGIISAFLLLGVVGCKSVDPNPELKDKIYLDIRADLEIQHKALKISEDFLRLAYEEEKSAELNSGELATIRRDIRDEKVKIEAIKQDIKYMEIRLERRLLESRLAYAKALESNEDWPNETEYQAYLAHKELRNAPNNWNERVPRLQLRINEYNRKMNGEEEADKK